MCWCVCVSMWLKRLKCICRTNINYSSSFMVIHTAHRTKRVYLSKWSMCNVHFHVLVQSHQNRFSLKPTKFYIHSHSLIVQGDSFNFIHIINWWTYDTVILEFDASWNEWLNWMLKYGNGYWPNTLTELTAYIYFGRQKHSRLKNEYFMLFTLMSASKAMENQENGIIWKCLNYRLLCSWNNV